MSGAAWNGLKKMAVFGQGPVGLSGTLSAKWMGANVIAIDVVPERLGLARELGADHVINSREADPVAAIRDLTAGAGASAMLVDAKVPLEKLITHRYRLEQAVEAFYVFDGATTGKCVFVMD